MTWLLILTLNSGMTPLIETKMFYTQSECEVYGNIKMIMDEKYTYMCTNIRELK